MTSPREVQHARAGLEPCLSLAAAAMLSGAFGGVTLPAEAQARDPYKVEWVYRIAYGHQDEWWRIFQKLQIAILDKEKQLGYVTDYVVVRPGLHTSEDARWDFRIVITYSNQASATHEAEVEKQPFPDRNALAAEEQRRWELTLNHWDLPIHQVDPHEPAE